MDPLGSLHGSLRPPSRIIYDGDGRLEGREWKDGKKERRGEGYVKGKSRNRKRGRKKVRDGRGSRMERREGRKMAPILNSKSWRLCSYKFNDKAYTRHPTQLTVTVVKRFCHLLNELAKCIHGLTLPITKPRHHHSRIYFVFTWYGCIWQRQIRSNPTCTLSFQSCSRIGLVD